MKKKKLDNLIQNLQWHLDRATPTPWVEDDIEKLTEDETLGTYNEELAIAAVNALPHLLEELRRK